MKDKRQYLSESIMRYPNMQVSDAVKFLYQGEFGGGHLIADPAASLMRLKKEYDDTKADPDIPVYEILSEKTARINIAAVKGKLRPETLNSVFVNSAQTVTGNIDEFISDLKILYEFFPADDVDRYLDRYIKSGCPAVSHSPLYREKYQPAYRVVSAEYLPLLPLLELGHPQRLLLAEAHKARLFHGPEGLGRGAGIIADVRRRDPPAAAQQRNDLIARR